MRNAILVGLLVLLLGLVDAALAQDPLDAVPCRPHAMKNSFTQRGLFTVHVRCDHVLYEIPPTMLKRVMLLSTEFAALWGSEDDGIAPGLAADTRVVRWVRQGDQVHLELVQYGIRASGRLGLQRAVEQMSLGFLIKSFEVVSEGAGGAALIDVTSLVTSEVPEGFAQDFRRRFRMAQVDPKRSYIESIHVFPQNSRANDTSARTSSET